MSLFTREFQAKILKLFLSDQAIFSKYSAIIESYFFENILAKNIYDIIFNFFKKYKILPDQTSLVQEAKNLFITGETHEFSFKDIEGFIIKVFNLEIEDKKYIEDSIISFTKNQAFKTYVLECSEAVSQDSINTTTLSKLRGRMDEVIRLGDDLSDIGHVYFDVDHIAERIKAREFGLRTGTIGTGIDFLDWYLEGGVCKGEFAFVIGGTGRGKSVFLTNIGKTAILANKHVFHYNLEMGQIKTSHRYDACFLTIPPKSLNKKNKEIIDKMRELYNLYNKHLIIKRLKYGQSSVMDIINHINLVEKTKKIRPDLIVVDYGDIMTPMFSKYKDKRNDQIEIFKELAIVLAEEQDVAVWSASQIGDKKGIKKETAGEEDVAEALAKINCASIVISLNQTEEEYAQPVPQGRIKLIKGRDTAKNKLIYVNMDFKNTMTVSWNMSLQAQNDPMGINLYEEEKYKRNTNLDDVFPMTENKIVTPNYEITKGKFGKFKGLSKEKHEELKNKIFEDI